MALGTLSFKEICYKSVAAIYSNPIYLLIIPFLSVVNLFFPALRVNFFDSNMSIIAFLLVGIIITNEIHRLRKRENRSIERSVLITNACSLLICVFFIELFIGLVCIFFLGLFSGLFPGVGMPSLLAGQFRALSYIAAFFLLIVAVYVSAYITNVTSLTLAASLDQDKGLIQSFLWSIKHKFVSHVALNMWSFFILEKIFFKTVQALIVFMFPNQALPGTQLFALLIAVCAGALGLIFQSFFYLELYNKVYSLSKEESEVS